MILYRKEHPARVYYVGEGGYTVGAKGKYQIRYKERGGDWINSVDEKIPDDKKWVITCQLTIKEQDE